MGLSDTKRVYTGPSRYRYRRNLPSQKGIPKTKCNTDLSASYRGFLYTGLCQRLRCPAFHQKNDLKSARDPNMRDRKAFEEDAFGKIWQADTCYFPYITENGKSRRVYCVMIIDDHSRLLVGGSLFYNDNAYNFQKVLKDAIATYGLPDKLLVDNGSPYSNEQLSMICVALGIVLIPQKADP